MIVLRLFISSQHSFVGRFGQEPRSAPMVEVDRFQLVAGRGIAGDRYAERDFGHKGQVTFFAEETWLKLQEKLARPDRGPEVFRRNVLVRGADLLALVGQDFEVQGVRFHGTEHCKPCLWMDQAFAPGALAALAAWSAGGLRAHVLSEGWLGRPPPA
jgi:MOSC domain-containing protein YiiM